MKHEAIVPKDRWHLDPSITFLNHGSFGATPIEVLEKQQRYQRQIESNPLQFVGYEYFDRWHEACDHAARFVRAKTDNVVIVPNATFGVNAVMQSLQWSAGDEVIVSSHKYPCVGNTALFLKDRYGAAVKTAVMPDKITRQTQLIDAYSATITNRTKLVVVDHISSASGLVMPIPEIIALCRTKKVPVLVDGAHGPGQVPIHLDEWQPDFYTGNFHKWLFAPRPVGFLYATPEWHDKLHPPLISNLYGQGYKTEFSWIGTQDPSAIYCVKSGMDFYAKLGAGMLAARNQELAAIGGAKLCEVFGQEPIYTLNEGFHGAMVAMPVPGLKGNQATDWVQEWRNRLLKEFRVEVHFGAIGDQVWIRLAAQAYNSSQDMDILASAVKSASNAGQ